MSAKEMVTLLGCEYLLTVDAFTIVVTVEDVKMAYGQARAFVQPVGGTGSAWVSVDRLSPYDPANGYY